MNAHEVLLINNVMIGLAAFLVGIGLKTIIDCFAARDDVIRRFEAIEDEIEELEDDVETDSDRLDDVEEWIAAAEDAKFVARASCCRDQPSEADVEAAKAMLRPPGELPPFGDYHKFIGYNSVKPA